MDRNHYEHVLRQGRCPGEQLVPLKARRPCPWRGARTWVGLSAPPCLNSALRTRRVRESDALCLRPVIKLLAFPQTDMASLADDDVIQDRDAE
jgi:hypothetical protein